MKLTFPSLFALAMLLIGFLCPGNAIAQEKKQVFQNLSSRAELSISAAKIDRESQKLFLHTPDRDLNPKGNAAFNYYRAALLHARISNRLKINEKVWRAVHKTPLNQLDASQFDDAFSATESSIAEIKLGAQRKNCHWQTSGFEGGPLTVVQRLLPEVDSFRFLHQLLLLKARLALREKKFDETIHWITIANQFAMHIGKMDFIVCGLVAKNMIESNLNVIDEMSGISGAPNLHHALVALPSPMVNLRKQIRDEIKYWKDAFPVLNNPAQQTRTSAEWREKMIEFYTMGQIIGGGEGPEPRKTLEKKFGWMAAQQYETAMKSLALSGMKKQDLEKMPVGQVISVHAAKLFDEYRKKSLEQLDQPAHLFSEPKFKRPGPMPLMHVTQYIVPTVGIARSEFKLSQRIAAAKFVQAVRHHMSGNNNQLPAKITQLDANLLSNNPYTNKPFEFAKVNSGIAIRRTRPLERLDLIEQLILKAAPSEKK